MPLSIRSFPQAILHVDGDAFFASCEQMRDPKLRGKPVVTGVERGIASSMSYEAKALGVTRGMPIYEIKRICPQCVIVPSDYETYGLLSLRMYDIVRRYTDMVEEYSIDECFADLTGLRRISRMSYEVMAENIQRDLSRELGVTFSVGLAPSKVLAKVASKWKKPSGLTVIPGKRIEGYLRNLPIGSIWGIGPQTSSFLQKRGVKTALQFAYKEAGWVEEYLTKPHREIWRELRGESVFPVDAEKKSEYKSVMKTRTFTPPSRDKELVFSHLAKNIEAACAKVRRYHQASKHIYAFLKTQDFMYQAMEIDLREPVSDPGSIIAAIRAPYEQMFNPRRLYRATGVTLADLTGEALQLDLFGGHAKIERMRTIYAHVDEVVKKYGSGTLFLGSSFLARQRGLHRGVRGTPAKSSQGPRIVEKNKRLNIPLIGEV